MRQMEIQGHLGVMLKISESRRNADDSQRGNTHHEDQTVKRKPAEDEDTNDSQHHLDHLQGGEKMFGINFDERCKKLLSR